MTNRLNHYQVFVWVSSADLQAMRDACLQMTWDSEHAACARFSEISSTTIEEQIRASNIFVCLTRTMDDTVRAYCEMAANHQKPILVFLFDPAREADVRECRNLMDAVPRGSRFKIVAENAQTLATEYLIALSSAVRILYESARPAASSEPTYFPNRFFHRLTSRMSQWWVLHHRSNVNPVLKLAIGEYVIEWYLRRLVAGGISKLFFESGSSVAFLSQAFADRLDDEWLKYWAQFEIETNNIFSYLEFLVAPSQRTSLFPEGPPDHKYGATFGRLLTVSPPLDPREPIGDRAREIMEEFRDHFRETYREGGVIFATTSGFDWRVGPHVGSYPNMLFKRAILEARCPTILLLDEDKLPGRCPFDERTCFAVGDDEFTWEQARQEVPLAIACAFNSPRSATETSADLIRLGFTHIQDGGRYNTPWCVIAANDRFAAEARKWSKSEADAIARGALRAKVRALEPASLRGN